MGVGSRVDPASRIGDGSLFVARQAHRFVITAAEHIAQLVVDAGHLGLDCNLAVWIMGVLRLYGHVQVRATRCKRDHAGRNHKLYVCFHLRIPFVILEVQLCTHHESARVGIVAPTVIHAGIDAAEVHFGVESLVAGERKDVVAGHVEL